MAAHPEMIKTPISTDEIKYTFNEWIDYLKATYQSNIEVSCKRDYYDTREINVYVKHPQTREFVHVYEEIT